MVKTPKIKGHRSLHRLSQRLAATTSAPGRHADGGGLYLVVSKAGTRSWTFVWRRGKAFREMGLGSLNAVSLARAREKAADARAALADGKDPLAIKRTRKEIPTFGALADEAIKTMSAESRNAKHQYQLRLSLETHAAALRPMRVDTITTEDVLGVLEPMWAEKPETASRLRGRIEHVLDTAAARGVRSGANPARWRGHLQKLLPERQKLTRGHYAAMSHKGLPNFVADLRARKAMSALALEFLILTASRPGEVLGAKWSELDLANTIWIVPPERMKRGVAHRIPLTGRALEILKTANRSKIDDHVFPSGKKGKPLSNMTFKALLLRMKVDTVTAHGFRSSFRTWAGDETDYPREVAEAALAHAVGDAVERSYMRSDALERRRALMKDWAAYCGSKCAVNAENADGEMPTATESPTND